MSASDVFCILGSNSFSGASMAAYLLERGHHVVGISRSPEPPAVMLPYRWGPHERFEFHQLDLNHDLDRVIDVIAQRRPAYVICFAAQGMVAESWKAPDQWFLTNTVAMVRLHDRLRKYDFLRRFVQVSTPEVYGNTEQRVAENAPYAPSSPYATSKLACDLNLLSFYRAYGFPCVITRSATVCGPGQQLYRIIPRTILCILLGKTLSLEGGGAARRNFIHIHDVAAGTLACCYQGEPGEIFHFATSQMISIRGLVETICQRLGADVHQLVEVTSPRLGEDNAYQLDWERAARELAWQPRKTLGDAIDETIRWVKGNLAELRGLPTDYVHRA